MSARSLFVSSNPNDDCLHCACRRGAMTSIAGASAGLFSAVYDGLSVNRRALEHTQTNAGFKPAFAFMGKKKGGIMLP